MKADQLLKLLKERHSDDVFVPECKNGSTHYANHLRFDAWVMKKSWVNECAIGYEIKVHRSDFLQDVKWQGYLTYCNEFYFVAPPGIIQPEELPPGIGLLVASTNGVKLMTKRKAVFRQVDIPKSIYQYILMARVHVKREEPVVSKREYFEQWMKQSQIDAQFGRQVSHRIRELVNAKILQVEDRLQKAEKQIASVENCQKILADHGFSLSDFDPERWYIEGVKKRLRRLSAGIPEGLGDYLERTMENLKRVQACFKDETPKE